MRTAAFIKSSAARPISLCHNFRPASLSQLSPTGTPRRGKRPVSLHFETVWVHVIFAPAWLICAMQRALPLFRTPDINECFFATSSLSARNCAGLRSPVYIARMVSNFIKSPAPEAAKRPYISRDFSEGDPSSIELGIGECRHDPVRTAVFKLDRFKDHFPSPIR